MYSERYQLVSKGQLLDGANHEKFKTAVGSRFRLDDKAIDRLVRGRPVSIKSDLDWNQVLRYREFFKSAGLDVQVRVVMGAEAFESALRTVADAAEYVAPDTTIRSQMLCDIRPLKSIIFSRVPFLNVFDESGDNHFILRSNPFKIGWVLMLAAVLFSSLTISNYTAQLLTYDFGFRTASTVISIIVLFACIPLLAVVLQPLGIMRFRPSGSQTENFACVELGDIGLRKRHYAIYGDGSDSYHVTKNRYGSAEVRCYNDKGRLVYSVTTRYAPDDESSSAVYDVASELGDLFDTYFLDYIRGLINYFQNLSNDPVIDDSTRFAYIYDENNKRVADIYLSSHIVVEFDETELDSRQRLFVLAMIAVGGC